VFRVEVPSQVLDVQAFLTRHCHPSLAYLTVFSAIGPSERNLDTI